MASIEQTEIKRSGYRSQGIEEFLQKGNHHAEVVRRQDEYIENVKSPELAVADSRLEFLADHAGQCILDTLARSSLGKQPAESESYCSEPAEGSEPIDTG